MKKAFKTMSVLMFGLVMTMGFVACGDDEKTDTTSYYYRVKNVSLPNYYDYFEEIEVQNAFDVAVGDEGGNKVNQTYSSPQDEAMKAKCEAVKRKYANIKSIYMKFELVRITLNTAAAGTTQEDIIATYELGQALVKPYMRYAFVSNGTEAFNALEAKKSSLDEKVYKASYKTLINLLGKHEVYDGSRTTGMASDFEIHFQSEFSKVWPDDASYDRYVVYACDSISNAHAADTLAVDVKLAAIKTGLLNKQVSTIWEKTIRANF